MPPQLLLFWLLSSLDLERLNWSQPARPVTCSFEGRFSALFALFPCKFDEVSPLLMAKLAGRNRLDYFVRYALALARRGIALAYVTCRCCFLSAAVGFYFYYYICMFISCCVTTLLP